MAAVYQKTLRLTSASRLQCTVGQTTNLMVIDSEKLFQVVLFMHFLWHGPSCSVIVSLLLIREIGVGPALLALVVIIILFPLQNWIADSIGKVRAGSFVLYE